MTCLQGGLKRSAHGLHKLNRLRKRSPVQAAGLVRDAQQGSGRCARTLSTQSAFTSERVNRYLMQFKEFSQAATCSGVRSSCGNQRSVLDLQPPSSTSYRAADEACRHLVLLSQQPDYVHAVIPRRIVQHAEPGLSSTRTSERQKEAITSAPCTASDRRRHRAVHERPRHGQPDMLSAGECCRPSEKR